MWATLLFAIVMILGVAVGVTLLMFSLLLLADWMMKIVDPHEPPSSRLFLAKKKSGEKKKLP